MDNGLTLLTAGLGVSLEDIAGHVVKGTKGLPVTRARVQQLLASGDVEDLDRAVAGLVKAARAKGWSDDRIVAATKVLAPEHSGNVLVAMLAEREAAGDRIAPYVRMLLRR